MAIIVTTASPRKLLTDIKAAIDEKKIDTWKYDSDGDFTHSPDQWNNRAWFRPDIRTDGLVFMILTPRQTAMSSTVYAVFHGRFIEMLLAHFDIDFSTVMATALPSHGDVVKAE